MQSATAVSERNTQGRRPTERKHYRMRHDHDEQSPTGAPMDVVLAWWQAIQDNDMARLAETLDDNYIATGGPAGRTVGSAAALAEAEMFLSAGWVAGWSVRDVLQRQHGDVAVFSYAWEETGQHLDADFTLAGLATDVLTRGAGGWKISAHHTSVLPTVG
jgi:ketosteroid isomerase-like protein